MPRPNRNISRFLRKIPLLLVYALFFIVQIFFNLDMPRKVSGSSGESSVTSARVKAAFSQKDDPGPAQSQKIRLNKRFHPSFFELIAQQVTPVCAGYVEKPVLGAHVNPHYLSPFVLAEYLRGPPVAA